MFLVCDDNDDVATPVMNYVIFAVCLAVFLYEYTLEHWQVRAFVGSYAFNIHDSIAGLQGAERAQAVLYAVFDPHAPHWWRSITAVFLHASPLHIAGNLFFLWVFGDNVEHVMGKLRFTVFFLLTGMIANAVEAFFGGDANVPCLGASGAISAVMGAYLMYYPRADVNVMWYRPWSFCQVLPETTAFPAWAYLLGCFAADLAQGIATQGHFFEVAVWAHVGGFLAGALLAWPFKDPSMVFMRDLEKQFRKTGFRGNRRPRRADPWEAFGGK